MTTTTKTFIAVKTEKTARRYGARTRRLTYARRAASRAVRRSARLVCKEVA